ncbi:MAG: hypothetical protein COX51_09680 [Syntrophobacteraceae bacterium CG23_combo_of_CG06-09_8_20_14_all_50_8]|nr:MAG: hypothetical protein COX51_09680 [Syntrophobacteraceae bacterium CG23_combo_of_CG06-09_8_20_14_all_50_8]
MTELMRKPLAILLAVALAATPAFAAENKGKDTDTYDQNSVLKDATEFFGKSTEGLAKVIEKAFKDHGRPNAYIKGEEASGAITVGLRYGDGTLVRKNGKSRKVHWSGPSIGFDFGGNASKVFVLVYHLDNSEQLFRRYPAVDGSFYLVGGAGINYQQRDKVILAPIRLGVGLRAGASIGYMHYTKTKTYNPF